MSQFASNRMIAGGQGGAPGGPSQQAARGDSEARTWDQVEDTIDAAIRTLERVMFRTVQPRNSDLSAPLRRLYSRSKKLRVARGKVLPEDKLDEERYMSHRCMLGL